MVGRSKTVTGPYLDKDGKAMNKGGGSLVIQGNKDYTAEQVLLGWTFYPEDWSGEPFIRINYQLAQQEDKTAIFEEWCSFLNFFDSSIKFELSFVNMATDSTEFEKSIRIPFQKDGFDDVRAEYSQMLRQQLAKGNNGLTKTKFITFGVEGESMAQVKPRLDHIQNDLMNNFHRLGVQAKPLNGAQRLKLMHDMFNMDGASKFHFDWKDLVKSGLSVKDAIAPTAFAFKNSRTFQMGGIFCAASFLSCEAIR